MSAYCVPGGSHGAAEIGGSHKQQYVSAGRDPNTVLHGMVRVPGDTFQMGGDDPDAFPDDGRRTSSGSDLASLCIEPTCVTNAQFAAFVKATRHVTDAERFGWSYVFHLLVGAEAWPSSSRLQCAGGWVSKSRLTCPAAVRR